MTERVEQLESIILEQREHSRKLECMQKIQALILGLFLLAFVAAVVMLGWNINKATQGLPELMETAQGTAVEIRGLVEDLEKVDFEQLSRSAEQAAVSINSIDMDALNSSIKDLELVAKKLASLFGG